MVTTEYKLGDEEGVLSKNTFEGFFDVDFTFNLFVPNSAEIYCKNKSSSVVKHAKGMYAWFKKMA